MPNAASAVTGRAATCVLRAMAYSSSWIFRALASVVQRAMSAFM